MSETSGGAGAGWHPDPSGRHEHRYWDGDDWTDQVSDGGVVSSDPPTPPTEPADEPTAVDQTAVGAVPPTQAAPPAGEVPPAYATTPTEPPGGGRSKVLPIVLGLLVVAVVAVVLVLVLGGGDDGGDSGSEVASDSSADVDQSEEPTDDTEDEPTDDTDDEPDEPEEPSDDTVDEPEEPSDGPEANDFDAGECTADDLSGDVGAISLVDCSQEHTAESIGQVVLDGTTFPGDAAIQAQATEGCQGDLFEEYVGLDYASSIYLVTYIAPTAQTWAQGDRVVICVINGTTDGSPLVGSAEGTAE